MLQPNYSELYSGLFSGSEVNHDYTNSYWNSFANSYDPKSRIQEDYDFRRSHRYNYDENQYRPLIAPSPLDRYQPQQQQGNDRHYSKLENALQAAVHNSIKYTTISILKLLSN
jgi:hypothetical protein